MDWKIKVLKGDIIVEFEKELERYMNGPWTLLNFSANQDYLWAVMQASAKDVKDWEYELETPKEKEGL